MMIRKTRSIMWERITETNAVQEIKDELKLHVTYISHAYFLYLLFCMNRRKSGNCASTLMFAHGETNEIRQR